MSLESYKIVTLFIFLASLASCSGTQPEQATSRPKTDVTLTRPVVRDFNNFIQLNGNTQFQKKLIVRSVITGYITTLPWKVGERISAGTLFCRIRTKEQQALKGFDSKETSLEQFQTPLDVHSNVSGIITAVNFSKGDFVNEGDIIATVTDPSSMVLVIDVPLEYRNYVGTGKNCLIKFPDGKVLRSVIQEVLPFVDSVSQTQQCIIRFPQNRSIPENMNLVVHIPVSQKQNSLALPLAAIQTNETEDQFWVMKLVNDSMAIKVPITVGIQNDSLREILSGVNINDKIIMNGAFGLEDSSLVKVQTVNE